MSGFTGTGRLFRLALRRDRIVASAWILGLWLYAYSQAASIIALYPTQADLDPRKKARTYSKGNRQKVALIAALASEVELLLLDEPTAGLDPLMEAAFREVIREELQSERTVLLSSHILAEVEALCERVSIIRAGRVVESGTLTELRHLTRTSIQAELVRPPDGLGGLAGVHDLQVDGTRVRLQVDPAGLDGVLRQLTSVGVRSLISQPPTLEELFLRHYDDRATTRAEERA